MEELLRSIVGLLSDCEWIYDLNMTELFCHGLIHRFPSHWLHFFNTISYSQLNELILSNTTDLIDIPTDLSELLNEIKKLEMYSRPSSYTPPSPLDKSPSMGLSAKKQHEIANMMPFVRAACNSNRIATVIDIGSGLGYLDNHLVDNSDLTVIGIEKKANFVQGANTKQQTSTSHRLINIAYTINDKSESELMSLVMEHQVFTENKKMAMVSLHSCGDLTPSMLRIFAANTSVLKLLIAFSCCYHSMNKNNFPMSGCLKGVLEESGFGLSVFGMRLACQEDISSLIKKSDSEHQLHVRQVGYRAILQKFCFDRNLKIKKLKRKLASKSEFESFQSYTSFISERIVFEDTNQSPVRIESLSQELASYYLEYSGHFDLIEPLTYLQLLLQPLLERLVLLDRVCYLNEKKQPGTINKLVKVFDSSISPRCVCILSEVPCNK